MKDHEDKFTNDLLGDRPKRGRKPKPDAKSAAQRAKEYRMRQKEEFQRLKELEKTFSNLQQSSKGN
jgi:hypothetical protein